MTKTFENTQALMFDVFGTLVDWRSSISLGLEKFFNQPDTRGIVPQGIEWDTVALDWRGRYQPSMEAVRQGLRDYVILDVLHRESLVQTLADHHIVGLDEHQLDALTLLWHRLEPWSDVPDALRRLRERKVLAALSNGNTTLLMELSRYAQLPWHVSLGAEPARAYKPQAKVYLQGAAMLALEPSQCMMVAAHNEDLAAARALGFRTAYVNRPTEYGVRQQRDKGPESDWDIAVESLDELVNFL